MYYIKLLKKTKQLYFLIEICYNTNTVSRYYK